MNTRITLFAALLAVSCATRNENSALVVTKIITPTATVIAGPPQTVSCTFDPSTLEVDILPFNPSAGQNRGAIALVIANRMPSSATVNTALRTDSNDFLAERVVINYDVIGGASLSQLVAPAVGTVPSGGTGTIGFRMLTPQLSTLAAGSVVRLTMHAEGKLLDGSLVHTAERESLIQICSGAGCAGNPCL